MNSSTTARKKRERLATGRGRQRTWLPTFDRLLQLAYDWQYIDREMIRAIEPNLVASDRTLKDQLHGLALLGHLQPVRRQSKQEMHLYTITPKGARELEQHKIEEDPTDLSYLLKPPYRATHHRHTNLFTEHARATSWFQTHVELAVRQRPDLTILQYERRYDVEGHELGSGRWRPDLGYLLSRQLPDGRTKIMLCLVEIDRGTMAPLKVFEKLEHSNAWFFDEGGAEYLEDLYEENGDFNPVPTYHRFILTQHRRGLSDFNRLVTLFTQALRLSGNSGRNIHFATASDLNATRGTDAPIWYSTNQTRRLRRTIIGPGLDRDPARFYPSVVDRLQQLTRTPLLPRTPRPSTP